MGKLRRRDLAYTGVDIVAELIAPNSGFYTTPTRRLGRRHSAEFLGESDEKSLRSADVAEPICVFITNHFAYELRTALSEPLQRVLNVVHGEHDA